MRNIAEILAPLYDILKGYTKKHRSVPINWTKNIEGAESFEKAKKAIAEETKLVYPGLNDKLSLSVDASSRAVGGALYIEDESGRKPLSFFFLRK